MLISFQNLKDGSRVYIYPVAVLFLLFLFHLTGCATYYPKDFVDFSKFQDSPLPHNAAPWLNSGSQTLLTPRIKALASQLSAETRRERLYNAVQYIWTNMRYDRWLNSQMFTRTADQLFQDKVLGGCSDFALVKVTLFRALKIPARLVITANVDWMLRYQKDPLFLTTGHAFIEVYLEDRWYLVDSTYRFLFSDYDAALKNYPRREYLCVKGIDYWEMGFTTVATFIEVAGELATGFQEDMYKDPDYPQQKI